MKHGKAVYVAGKMDKKAAAAYGRYNNTLMSTGWGVLEIRAGYGALTKNHDLMYAAGFLEGVFTARYKLTSAGPSFMKPCNFTRNYAVYWSQLTANSQCSLQQIS